MLAGGIAAGGIAGGTSIIEDSLLLAIAPGPVFSASLTNSLLASSFWASSAAFIVSGSVPVKTLDILRLSWRRSPSCASGVGGTLLAALSSEARRLSGAALSYETRRQLSLVNALSLSALITCDSRREIDSRCESACLAPSASSSVSTLPSATPPAPVVLARREARAVANAAAADAASALRTISSLASMADLRRCADNSASSRARETAGETCVPCDRAAARASASAFAANSVAFLAISSAAMLARLACSTTAFASAYLASSGPRSKPFLAA